LNPFPTSTDDIIQFWLGASGATSEMASQFNSRRKPAFGNQISLFGLPIFLSLLLIILNIAKPADALLSTCYDPDGAERTDTPCNPNAAASACCANGWGQLTSNSNFVGSSIDQKQCAQTPHFVLQVPQYN
jgi:hypothetical protein